MALVACGSSDAGSGANDGGAGAHDGAIGAGDDGAAGDDASSGDDGGPGSDASVPCTTVTDASSVVIANAASADDFALYVEAASASATHWGQAGNEAVVLEVSRGATKIGELVLHQGKVRFTYGMHVGALAVGDPISVRVSPRSATMAQKSVCVGKVTLTSATDLGAAGEGLKNAPIFVWPAKKIFDDLPVMTGWSKGGKSYQAVYTNENGGTTEQCGGGASGLQAEIARWGRSVDIEGMYSYGGAAPSWERCTGTVPTTTTAIRMEAAHPILYYGDGHNRLFESRGGYGQTCGSGSPEKADGDIPGWNTQNPGNEAAKDDAYVVTVRPLPVDLDALGYRAAGGRREAMLDHYAPWLYRITSEEVTREGKIDNSKTFPLEQYMFVDVHASDVGGSGDRVCSFTTSGGFVLRLKAKDGTTVDGPQMTADYFGGDPGWKRISIPLPKAYKTSDFTQMIFDAYDNDGIYLLSIGDAFIPRASGDNGATLDYLRQGTKDINVYVDDGNSGCTNGTNSSGPGGTPYPCVGTLYTFTP